VVDLNPVEFVAADGAYGANPLAVAVVGIAMPAGVRVGHHKRFARHTHKGLGVVVADDGVAVVGIEPHGDADLIGNLAAGGPVGEFVVNQAADILAPLEQLALPGGLGDLVQDAGSDIECGGLRGHLQHLDISVLNIIRLFMPRLIVSRSFSAGAVGDKPRGTIKKC
jgi:hypothetical protein